MERFDKIALNIRNLNPKVVIHHMITPLRLGPFSDSMCKKLAGNIDELWYSAAKFMQLEELKEFKNLSEDRRKPGQEE